MRPLLPMSCLTLINEGADTGGISESRGDAEARGHPRRRAGAGREKATATPPRPVGKGKGEARAGATAAGRGPPRTGTGRGAGPQHLLAPGWGHWRCRPPVHTACPRPLSTLSPIKKGWSRMSLLRGHSQPAYTRQETPSP